MRVLAVTNMYPTGRLPALGVFVEKQIEGLRRIGIDVDLMIVDRAGEGVTAYRKLRRQIRSRIVNSRPTLIHVMYGGVMADIVTRAVDDRPTIVSFCGSDLLGEQLSGRLRRWLSMYGVFASRRAARRASGIIVKSRNLQNFLPEDVDRSRVRIIPNGVDLHRFKPLDRDVCRQRLHWSAHDFHVLFPSNCGDPCKQPELAHAAVERVRLSGIRVAMHALEGVPHHEVPVWLNASDVVLLTSRHEGSPNVIKEAIACNVPVVSVDVGDVRERIDGISGCYIAWPDPGDLAAKLALVYSGPRRVEGRSRMQELSLERVAWRLSEFYDEVVKAF